MKIARFVCCFVVVVSTPLVVQCAVAQSDLPAQGGPPSTLSATTKLSATQFAPELSFHGPVRYYSGTEDIWSVAAGDVNGDGKIDVVIATDGPTVSVLFGNGDGTLRAPISYNIGSQSSFVTVADVNGDGHPDIIATINPNNIGAVVVLLNSGNGVFEFPVTYSFGGTLVGRVFIADVNGDGHPDLITDNGGTVGVLLNKGDGTFQTPASYPIGALGAVGDLNGDGIPDLALAIGLGVGIALGNGDGTFQSPVDYSSNGYPEVMTLGDVNGDGKPDLEVAVICDIQCSNAAVNTYLGNGDGTLQPALLSDLYGEDEFSMSLADLDGSGKGDLVISKRGAATAQVMVGVGDGTFSKGQTIHSGVKFTNQVIVADLNGDGRPDLILAGSCATQGGCTMPATNLDVALNQSIDATTTALTSSANPALINQSVTFTATVSSVIPVPDGSPVTFSNLTTVIGTGTTVNGVASMTTSFAQAKSYTIKARFAGGGFLKPSSGATKEKVQQ